MKKRILTLLFVAVVVLSGCGNKTEVDYNNPQTYMDAIVERINELDEDYLPTLNELVDTTDSRAEFDSLVDSYEDIIESVINKAPEQTEKFYKAFDEELQGYTGDLVDSTETLQGVIDKYNDAGEGVQELYSKTLNATFKIFSNLFDKISDFIDDASKEDLENLKDLSDFINEYEEKTGESFKDSLKEEV